jgi:hypothetical protein
MEQAQEGFALVVCDEVVEEMRRVSHRLNTLGWRRDDARVVLRSRDLREKNSNSFLFLLQCPHP